MTFEQALKAMLKGKKVKRKASDDIVFFDWATLEFGTRITGTINSSYGIRVVSFGDDILADDWEICEDESNDETIDEKALKESLEKIKELEEKCKYWQSEYEKINTQKNNAEQVLEDFSAKYEQKKEMLKLKDERMIYLLGKIEAYEKMLDVEKNGGD